MKCLVVFILFLSLHSPVYAQSPLQAFLAPEQELSMPEQASPLTGDVNQDFGLTEATPKANPKPQSVKNKKAESSFSSPSQPSVPTDGSTERVLWNGTPIAVSLIVGQERQLMFPGSIQRTDIPQGLGQGVINVQVINNLLFIKATKAFNSTRIFIIEQNTQRVYILSIKAHENGVASSTLAITLPNNARPDTSKIPKRALHRRPGGIGKITLTRFAAQQLYAPARLLKRVSGIRRVPVDTTLPVPLIRGDIVIATPHAAWSGGGLFVTAVKLVNTTNHSLRLAPARAGENRLNRILRGSWLAATPHHAKIGPAGTATDTTVLYLISTRPFSESFVESL